MRASLASATSLLALLLVEARQAWSAPIVSTGVPALAFGDILVGTSATLTGQSVATVTGGGNTTLTISSPSGQFSGSPLSASITNSGTQSFASAFTFAPLSTGSGTPITQVLTITDNGAGSNSVTTTLSGRGVAPLEVITTSNPFLLVGTTGTINLTVTNTGNGNTAKNVGSSVSNLNGTVGGGGASVLTGAGGSFSLADGKSTSLGYSYTPTTRGATASQAVVTTFSNGINTAGTGLINNPNSAGSVSTLLTATGVAAVQSVTSSGTTIGRVGTALASQLIVSNLGDGNRSSLATATTNLNGSVSTTLGAGVTASAGNPTTVSLTDAGSTASSTLAYTYTPISRGTVSSTAVIAFTNGNASGSNTAQTVSSVFVDQAVSPTYASTLAGKADTPTAVAHGATGTASSTISFGSLGYKQAVTLFLALGNTSTDPGGALTNLTIESFSISGADAGAFSPTLTAGSVITQGNQLLLPITVTNSSTGNGVLNSSLTIFTDESAALGGIGDTFTYALTALAVPEPASLAALGVGLAGLASIRRRRQQ